MNDAMKKFPSFLLLPNMISLLNFFCGFISIVMIAHHRVGLGAWLILAALILDALDGNIARIFNNTSSLGKELDSLADLASFVIAPAFLSLTFLWNDRSGQVLWVVFFYLACGFYRLGRFNLQAPVRERFEGLPTPAASSLISMVVLSCLKNDWNHQGILPWLLFISSALMVSKIHYPKMSTPPITQWKWLILLEFSIGAIAMKLYNIETAISSMMLAYVLLAPIFKPQKLIERQIQQ